MKIDEFIAVFPLIVMALSVVSWVVYLLVDTWPWPVWGIVISVFLLWYVIGLGYLINKDINQ